MTYCLDRERLRELARAHGVTFKRLSLSMGKDAGYIATWLRHQDLALPAGEFAWLDRFFGGQLRARRSKLPVRDFPRQRRRA